MSVFLNMNKANGETRMQEFLLQELQMFTGTPPDLPFLTYMFTLQYGFHEAM